MASIFSNSFDSIIETSSMIRTCVRIHRVTAARFRRMYVRRRSGVSLARPTPPKLCSVIPPMLQAAMPVEAVTATASTLLWYFWRRSWMICRSRCDLPAPAEPVKKTLRPCVTTASRMRCCSGERKTLAVERCAGATGVAGAGSVRDHSLTGGPTRSNRLDAELVLGRLVLGAWFSFQVGARASTNGSKSASAAASADVWDGERGDSKALYSPRGKGGGASLLFVSPLLHVRFSMRKPDRSSDMAGGGRWMDRRVTRRVCHVLIGERGRGAVGRGGTRDAVPHARGRADAPCSVGRGS